MEIVVLLVISLGAIAGVSAMAVSLTRSNEKGWVVAAEANREIRTLLSARVSTLENRLQADSITTFAELQHIPDELAKSTYAELNQRDYFQGAGLHRDGSVVEPVMSHSRAEDLEGSDFEGPTVG